MAGSTQERGSIVLEFAATIPLIVGTFLTMLDLGFCLNQYLKVSRIAYEGARYASSIAGLNEGICLSDNTSNSCVSDRTNQQGKVHTRVMTLLQDNNLPSDLNEVSIRTEFWMDAPQVGSEQESHPYPRIIWVRVSVPYHPIFPMYPHLNMRVTRSGPYLYRPKV